MAFKHFQITNQSGVAKIKIIGPITWWKNRSEEFTRMIDDLIEQGTTDIDCYINCPGGDMFHANEIVNQLHRFKGKKTLLIGAMAASAAFTIVLAFDKENTRCYSNTMGMYHDPSGLLQVKSLDDFDSNKKLYSDLRDDVIERIASRTGLTKEVVSENMRKTTWLNSKELKKLNIVSGRIDEKDKVPVGTKNTLENMGIEIPDFMNQVEESELDDMLQDENSEPDPNNANQNSNHNETEMKELAKKLGLPENATATDIANAFEALQNKAKFGEEALVNLCVSKGIKQENAEKSVQNNFDGTLELVNGIETPANSGEEEEEEEEEGKGSEGKTKNKTKTPSNTRPSTILDALKQELGVGGGGSTKNKKLEDYTEAELDEMENNEPEKFEQLFNESELGQVKNPQD